MTDCDIQSSGRAAPFAFTRLFAHMFVFLWEGDGERREKGVLAPNLH